MSKFQERLRSGKFLVTAGITPPKGTNLEPFLGSLEKLRDRVDAVDFPDNRSARIHLSALAASLLARDKGIEPILTFGVFPEEMACAFLVLLGYLVVVQAPVVYVTQGVANRCFDERIVLELDIEVLRHDLENVVSGYLARPLSGECIENIVIEIMSNQFRFGKCPGLAHRKAD